MPEPGRREKETAITTATKCQREQVLKQKKNRSGSFFMEL